MSSSLTQLPPQTSSLTSLPSLESVQEPHITAPRRTYGRQRAASPEADPPISLFRPTEEVQAIQRHTAHTSPAKGLLDRWSTTSSVWRGSLAGLGMDEELALSEPVVDQGEELIRRAKLSDFSGHEERQHSSQGSLEDDEDMVRKEMERLRREARGEAAPAVKATAPSSGQSRSNHIHTLNVQRPLAPTTSTSTLTTLSSSPRRSSPNRIRNEQSRRAERIEEETAPIRNSAAAARQSGKARRIVTSDTEDEDEGASSSRQRGMKGTKGQSPASQKSADSPATASPEEVAPPEHHLASMFDEFVNELGEGNQDEEVESDPKQSSSEPVGLFDDGLDDLETEIERGVVKTKEKPLKQKDLHEMRKEMARVVRSKPIAPPKPEPVRLPLGIWLTEATRALKQDAPGLDQTKLSSPPSSPTQTTPQDEIETFTPSSTDRLKLRPKTSTNISHIEVPEDYPSSPTPANGSRPAVIRTKIVIPGTSEDAAQEEDEDNMPSLLDMFEQQQREEEAKRKKVEQAAKLQRMKAAAMKQKQPAIKDDLDEDDFAIIEEKRTPSKAHPKSALPAKSPSAKAVLQRDNASPKLSKQKLDFLRRAGKSARTKGDVTETLAEFVGKTFDHAGLRRANGGAKPAGQKKGRESAISMQQVNAMIYAGHKAQAAAFREQREKDWGKVRSLPHRREQDMESIIKASEKLDAKYEPMSDEDDNADDEFIPDDEDEDEEEEGGEAEVFSGESDEELEEAEDEEAAGESDTEGTANKENEPLEVSVESDGEEPIVQRKHRSTARRAIDSDDDGDITVMVTNKTARLPLAEVEIDSALIRPEQNAMLVGFGDSPGFSQLFEATQLNDPSGQQDALHDLRGGNDNFLGANALLPGIEMSETQMERDNALIAAEVECVEQLPKAGGGVTQRYLNDQGFFTQTKLAGPFDQRGLLRRRSTLSLGDLAEEVEEDADDEGQDGASLEPSQRHYTPTQTTQTFSRLKRRRTSDPDRPDESMANPISSPPVAKKRNVFDHMMIASKRNEEKRIAAIDNNLIDEQAAESDEDNGWASLGGEEDENEEGMDDAFVKELVDDAEIDTEEKQKQDELAAEKARQIEEADDAKREAEARKITEGHYRTKRRGQDFYSDGEDEEGDEERGGKRRKWSKKERRKRRLDREDGLEKLEGEANAFLQTYNEDLESDEESVTGEDEMSREKTRSPTPEIEKRSGRETWDMLRQRARMNRERNASEEIESLDKEIGFDRARFQSTILEEDEIVVETEEESLYSISRSIRTTTSIAFDAHQQSVSVSRSADSYARYVQEESQTTRRTGGAAGVSVVVNNNGLSRLGSASMTGNPASRPPLRAPSRGESSSSGGSILQSRANRFN